MALVYRHFQHRWTYTLKRDKNVQTASNLNQTYFLSISSQKIPGLNALMIEMSKRGTCCIFIQKRPFANVRMNRGTRMKDGVTEESQDKYGICPNVNFSDVTSSTLRPSTS